MEGKGTGGETHSDATWSFSFAVVSEKGRPLPTLVFSPSGGRVRLAQISMTFHSR